MTLARTEIFFFSQMNLILAFKLHFAPTKYTNTQIISWWFNPSASDIVYVYATKEQFALNREALFHFRIHDYKNIDGMSQDILRWIQKQYRSTYIEPIHTPWKDLKRINPFQQGCQGYSINFLNFGHGRKVVLNIFQFD